MLQKPVGVGFVGMARQAQAVSLLQMFAECIDPARSFSMIHCTIISSDPSSLVSQNRSGAPRLAKLVWRFEASA